MMIRRCFLVVRANGEARVLNRVSLRSDEVAFRLVIDFPEGWGKVASEELHVTMPDPPTAEVVNGGD